MSKKIDYEHFDPSKISLAGGKVVIHYYDLSDPSFKDEVTGSNLPTEEFKEALDAFSEIFARSLKNLDGYETGMQVIQDAKPKEYLKRYEELMRARDLRIVEHNPTGVTFIGDKKKGIQIAGTLKGQIGSTGGFAAPKVYFESDDISYGDKAFELAENLRERAYGYLFQGEWIAAEPKSKEKDKADKADPAQTNLLDQIPQEGGGE